MLEIMFEFVIVSKARVLLAVTRHLRLTPPLVVAYPQPGTEMIIPAQAPHPRDHRARGEDYGRARDCARHRERRNGSSRRVTRDRQERTSASSLPMIRIGSGRGSCSLRAASGCGCLREYVFGNQAAGGQHEHSATSNAITAAAMSGMDGRRLCCNADGPGEQVCAGWMLAW
jgi:hypothetical protein